MLICIYSVTFYSASGRILILLLLKLLLRLVSEYLINLDLLLRFHFLKVFAFGFLDSYILSYEAILFLV